MKLTTKRNAMQLDIVKITYFKKYIKKEERNYNKFK